MWERGWESSCFSKHLFSSHPRAITEDPWGFWDWHHFPKAKKAKNLIFQNLRSHLELKAERESNSW